jgi:hypothetical protein
MVIVIVILVGEIWVGKIVWVGVRVGVIVWVGVRVGVIVWVWVGVIVRVEL